ncbi:MAG: hypothetical protein H6Q86_860 [candidate division NC10 bacterium]|jgi:hypothetical protein|nr:hypothetical protein [candidate division NC10 bacterium]
MHAVFHAGAVTLRGSNMFGGHNENLCFIFGEIAHYSAVIETEGVPHIVRLPSFSCRGSSGVTDVGQEIACLCQITEEAGGRRNL